MNKHTPGPWFVRYCDDDYYQCMTVISSKDFGPSNTTQYADEPSTIAIVYHQLSPTVGVDRNNEEQDSNVRLIVAAPELLELLKECVVDLEVFIKGYHDNIDPERDFDTIKRSEALDMEIIHRAKSVIAKATGENHE